MEEHVCAFGDDMIELTGLGGGRGRVDEKKQQVTGEQVEGNLKVESLRCPQD